MKSGKERRKTGCGPVTVDCRGGGGPFLHPLPRLYSSTDTILKREAFGGIEYQYQGKEQTAYDILTFYLCKRKNGGHEPIGASTGSEKCGPGNMAAVALR